VLSSAFLSLHTPPWKSAFCMLYISADTHTAVTSLPP
jgi:hypothetical protein